MSARYIYYFIGAMVIFGMGYAAGATYLRIAETLEILSSMVVETSPLRTLEKTIQHWMLSSVVLAAAVMLIFALPFVAHHSKTLGEVRSARERLEIQATALRTTYSTMENLLEDIIYEKKQTHRTSEINARLAAIINNADDAIFSLNLAGFITTANDAAIRTFGEHCEGKRFVSLFSADTGTRLQTLMLTTAEQNIGSTLDIQLQKRQRRLDLSLTLSPIRAEKQEVIGFSVIAKDISNTKLEEERFRLAVEAAPNAMIMINHKGSIVLVNSEAEILFGYSREELQAQPVHMLVPEGLRIQHMETAQQALVNPSRDNKSRGMHLLSGQRKNGEVFPAEVGLTPIEIHNEIHIISSIVDISLRLKQHRDLEKLNEELQRKNQEMEQFIYAVSHDLKAPLVTIAGFAARLKKSNQDSFSAGDLHKIDRILANVQSMESLLQDLLHLSRVIKRDLEKTWIETDTTIDHVLDSLDGSIKKSGAMISIDRPLPRVYAQESLLFQCLQNIVANALKYKQPDSIPAIHITGVRSDGFTGISVLDNGIGIEPQHQTRIFNVFERLNPEIGEGSGVGLAIVKTIIDKHHGRIELESVPMEGTRFTIFLPDHTPHAGA